MIATVGNVLLTVALHSHDNSPVPPPRTANNTHEQSSVLRGHVAIQIIQNTTQHLTHLATTRTDECPPEALFLKCDLAALQGPHLGEGGQLGVLPAELLHVGQRTRSGDITNGQNGDAV